MFYPKVLWTDWTEGLVLKPNDIMVRAFDGSKIMVHREVDLPIKVGTQAFNSNFYVMDICPTYSCLLGRPWIHGASAVTFTLHQKLKYPVKGKIVTVCGEEEYMVSHLNYFKYVEMDGEFIETPCQTFEVIPPTIVVAKASYATLRITKDPPRKASLKDARVVVEEGGCTIWGKLSDILYKSDKFGLGFTSNAQKAVHRARARGPPLKISNQEVNAIADGEEDGSLEDWIFPTVNRGLRNWEARDFVPITFIS